NRFRKFVAGAALEWSNLDVHFAELTTATCLFLMPSVGLDELRDRFLVCDFRPLAVELYVVLALESLPVDRQVRVALSVQAELVGVRIAICFENGIFFG